MFSKLEQGIISFDLPKRASICYLKKRQPSLSYLDITAIVLCDFVNYLAPFCDFKTNNGLRKRYKLPNIWFLPNANSCPSIQKCSIWGKVLTPINKSYLHI